MKKSNQMLSKVLLGSFSVSLFLLFRYIKMSSMMGSSFCYFSFSDMLMPLTGIWGMGFASLMAGSRWAFRVFALSQSFASLSYYVPGLFASAYWSTENKLISLIVPTVCIAAFLLHPVGWQAGAYTLYWLIPMALYFVPEKTVLMHSFSATFIAHSVGSVLWLYARPATPEMWLALIPVVACERIIFAFGMTGIYYAAYQLKYYSVKVFRHLAKSVSA